jgi:hypothetical protein
LKVGGLPTCHVSLARSRSLTRPCALSLQYSDAKVTNRNVRYFGTEIDHAADSRHPPVSLYTMVARTEGYAYAAKV